METAIINFVKMEVEFDGYFVDFNKNEERRILLKKMYETLVLAFEDGISHSSNVGVTPVHQR